MSMPETNLVCRQLIAELRQCGDAEVLAGQRRFGITPKTEQIGIRVPILRSLAKPHRKEHELAMALWKSGLHEARILASFIADPRQVTPQLMDAWVADFDSWDICDQVCGNLFDKTPYAIEKAVTWSSCKPEFVKRAGFVLVATMAVHRKELSNDELAQFFPIIEREAGDARNFVKKAINWALRQLGKRNAVLHREAIACAKRLLESELPTTVWIARDALREFARLPSHVQRRMNE